MTHQQWIDRLREGEGMTTDEAIAILNAEYNKMQLTVQMTMQDFYMATREAFIQAGQARAQGEPVAPPEPEEPTDEMIVAGGEELCENLGAMQFELSNRIAEAIYKAMRAARTK